jgi:hypothetical protein
VTTITTQGFNLVEDPNGCISNPGPTDVVDQSPQLGPLTLQGGPTPTMAIPTTSPAFDVIPPDQCVKPFDQRGVPRPQGPRCDIGAFEAQVQGSGQGEPGSELAAGVPMA